jgi:hypothetical protein
MTPKQPNRDALLQMTRRYFFKVCGYGIGSLALNALMQPKLFAGEQQQPPRAQAAALQAPRQAHYLPVYGGRALAD